MPPLPAPIDHEAAHRASLRRVAQERARCDDLEAALLHTIGGLMGIIQQAQAILEGVHRERRVQAAGHEITSLLSQGNHD